MKVLILSYTNLKNDPRPYRQIKSLYQNVEVHTIGTSKSGLEKTFTKLIKNNFIIDAFRILLLKLRLYDNYYWDNHKKKILSGKNNSRYNLLIAHEIRLVPLALKLAKGSPVILDAHEYSPKNFDDSLIWRFFIKKYYTYLCDKYLPMVDKIITVSPGIVNAYKKNYSIKPILITNACEYAEKIAQQFGVLDRVRFFGFIPFEELPLYYNLADIFVSVPSSDSVPVTLQEAMACGVPPIVSDLPAVKEFVQDGVNGYVIPIRDADTLAKAIIETLESKNMSKKFINHNLELVKGKSNFYKNMEEMLTVYQNTFLKNSVATKLNKKV